MRLFNETYNLLRKEIILEWRSKYAFNGVLLYIVSTVFICYISFNLNPGFRSSQGYPIVWNILFLDHHAVCIGKRYCQKLYAGE
jgi:heme exporter protein B